MTAPLKRRTLLAATLASPFATLHAATPERRFAPQAGAWRTFDLTLSTEVPQDGLRVDATVPLVDGSCADWRAANRPWSMTPAANSSPTTTTPSAAM